MENGDGAQEAFDVDLAEKIKVVRASDFSPDRIWNINKAAVEQGRLLILRWFSYPELVSPPVHSRLKRKTTPWAMHYASSL